jgi:preprotein translocase subunit YajC
MRKRNKKNIAFQNRLTNNDQWIIIGGVYCKAINYHLK